MTGYSGTPLPKKLGLKSGMVVRIINAPAHYLDLLTPFPQGLVQLSQSGVEVDWMHAFVHQREALLAGLPLWKQELASHGALWISWPKGSSRLATDLKGGIVRSIGLDHGLVDIKVCAVDKDWSALKFVYRLVDRKN